MNQQQALPKAANFGDLALNLGNNMEIDLQVAHIGSIERVGKKNTPCQKCILKDQGGNQEKCTIWMGRTGTALADINCNKWLTFNLSASKYKGESQYGGFWQTEAPVITQAPPQAPLAAQNPVASTIVPDGRQGIRYPDVYAFPVTPETQERMARSVGAACAGQVVAAMIRTACELQEATAEKHGFDWNGKLLEIADMMAMWIGSGNVKVDEPQADTSQVCPQCQLLRVDCTCPTEQFVR